MSDSGLVCFTNCSLLQEDGSLIDKDLWIDSRRGIVLDAQQVFYARKERPSSVIDLGGNILSPGLLDNQINGAYGFEFGIYDGNDVTYRAGLDMVACRIVETGVTSLLPTIITQDASIYPHLLHLLHPHSPAPSESYPHGGAAILGWHAEGPFIAPTKRGAHALPFLKAASNGIADLEAVYGADNLIDDEDWLLSAMPTAGATGVRMVTLAPEVPGMIDKNIIGALTERGVRVAIGHSVAGADVAARSIRRGAIMVTHLFNAMPQLHHRDPGIIGLLGASPAAFNRLTKVSKIDGVHDFSASSANPRTSFAGSVEVVDAGGAEALDEQDTPPHTPIITDGSLTRAIKDVARGETDTKRPFFGMIVDGVHSHPNSVRLAYTAHKDGCILVTDAMAILDPNLPDGTYDWRDGRRVTKEGFRLYLEGTDTLAGSLSYRCNVQSPDNQAMLVLSLWTLASETLSVSPGVRWGTRLNVPLIILPSECLGIENKKGTLRAGADADLVVLDRGGNVLSTWVRGYKVWSRA